MDAGMIKQFKGNYRRLLTRKRIHSFDAKIEFSVNLLDAINFIHTAWYQIPSSHIANCFHHAGFKKINAQPTDLSFSFTELDLIWDHMVESGLLSNDVSLNDYISFDDQLVTRSSDISSTPTLQFDDVFLVNSEDEDENNDSEAEEPPTSTECLSCIEKIRYFFQCSKKEGLDCSNILFQEIQSIEDAIHIVKSNNIHQTYLETYFKAN